MLGCLALSALAAPAASAAPEAREAAAPAKVAVLTSSAEQLLDSRRLRVRVRFGRIGTVRLYARVGRTRLAVGRLLRFAKPGRKRVSLRLTRPAARLIRRARLRCSSSRLAVYARARRYRTRGGRTNFSSRQRSRRSRTIKRVRVLRAGCGSRGSPAPGGGPGNPGGGGSPPRPPVGLRAGAATSDITPPIGTPMFAYTARSNLASPPTSFQEFAGFIGGDRDPDQNLYAKSFEPSNGIHTRVRASAIVIEQGGEKFALAQADLGGLPFALTQEVLKRVEDTGVTGERLLLSATHTHSSTGPIWPGDSTGYGLLGGDVFDPRIFELTAEGIAEAIRAANERLEPARVGTGVAEITNASRNREFDPFKLNPEVQGKTEEEARALSIDREVHVVRVDAADGEPLGVWSSFAIHPTSFGDSNLLLSGDNAATAEREAEAAIAQEAADEGHPGARPVNVWTNSNEGDISPNGGPDRDGSDDLQYVKNSFGSANLAGRRTAAGIVAAWRNAEAQMRDDVDIGARRSIMAFDGTTLTEHTGEERVTGPVPELGIGVVSEGICGPNRPPPEAHGNKITVAGGPLIPNTAPVSVWRIGSHGIVALPSEVTKTQGERIRKALVADSGGRILRFALAGLTNSYNSYTATPEEYDACTYEGGFTLFGRLQGPRYGAVSRGVLAALIAGTQPPSVLEPPPTALGGEIPTVDQTPAAGQTVAEPAPTVARYGRATFTWKGGDPAADAPRNATFVALQREVGPGDWRTVGTDDGVFDTTAFDEDTGEWTETWQFTECDPLGTYRFRVTGQADRGSGVEPYSVTSRSFELRRTAPLTFDAPVVSGGTATVVARYPDPGAAALVALPRRVRSGFATLLVNGQEQRAGLDSARLRFTAPVPAGATVSVKEVVDGCGNATP